LDAAWTRWRQVFLVDGINWPNVVEGHALGTCDYQRSNRIKWDAFFTWQPDPPDVLAVWIPNDLYLKSKWEQHFLDRDVSKQPKYLVVVERARDLLRSHRGAYRPCVKRSHWVGYEGVLKHVDSSICGFPNWGSFFAMVYYQTSLGVSTDIALKLIGDPELLPWTFQNCLLPVGVPGKLCPLPGPGRPKSPLFPRGQTMWGTFANTLWWTLEALPSWNQSCEWLCHRV
jgi:hypothetical protein